MFQKKSDLHISKLAGFSKWNVKVSLAISSFLRKVVVNSMYSVLYNLILFIP